MGASGQELLSGLKTMAGYGGANKAVLCLVKHNKAKKKVDDLSKELKGIQSKLLADTKWALGSGAKDLGAKSLKDIKASKVMENSSFLAVPVQYNPASIRLDSVGGDVQVLKNEEDIINRQLDSKTYDPKTTMSFDLVFDDYDQFDAFMLENPINVSSLGKKAVKGIANKVKGKGGYSVQEKMEAFIGMFARDATQLVLFFWGSMSFHGIVTRTDITYTMFNPQGNPIRGIVRLQIEQDMAMTNTFSFSRDYWEGALKKGFQKQGGVRGALAKAGNLLNFT